MTDHDESDESGDVFDRAETVLRQLTGDDRERLELPDDLWGRIEAEVAADVTSDVTSDNAAVIQLDRHRTPFARFALISAVAAAALLVIGGVVLVAQRDESDSMLVATAQLSYDPDRFDALGADAAANVSLVDDDGTLRVEIDRSDLPSPDGESADLELWLIEPDADGNPVDLVSLGLIDPGDPGDFTVPDDYDPDVFFVVDISVEPRDGDASHSGRSILRGPLVEA